MHDPRFGDIPLIPRADGLGWEYDPYYQPPLPPGAVRGDISRQSYCPTCHRPRYFYRDQHKTCVQCGDAFVFSAREQKFWYERLGFYLDSEAIRCRRCRKQQRTMKALARQVSALRDRQRDAPDDPAVALELAETTVRFRETTGEGDLDRAVANARRARRRWPENRASLFWEARAQQLAGREDRAVPLYQTFVDKVGTRKKYRKLAERARHQLDAIGR